MNYFEDYKIICYDFDKKSYQLRYSHTTNNVTNNQIPLQQFDIYIYIYNTIRYTITAFLGYQLRISLPKLKFNPNAWFLFYEIRIF